MALLLENARWLDPEGVLPEGAALLLEGERIAAHLPPGGSPPEGAERVDLAGLRVAPGFLDLHFHGELIFARGDAFAPALARRATSALRHGTTAFLATTVATERARLGEDVSTWAAAIAAQAAGGARAIGLHLEGPWINEAAAGAQPRSGIRGYEPAEGEDLLARASGLVRMVTLAPEIPGAEALMTQLARRGIVGALGHSLAPAARIDASVDAGMTHTTHLFNAMGPLHHREPGVALTVLADDRLSADLICDGVHVDPRVARTAARAKGEKLSLVTDQVDPRGQSDFGSGALELRDSAWRLPGGTLAGSALELDDAFRNAARMRVMTRLEAIAAVTLRPARVLGIERERGTLRPGAFADFAMLDAEGRVRQTWIAGRRAYDAAD